MYTWIAFKSFPSQKYICCQDGDDKRTVSICESTASTVTAYFDSDGDDNGGGDSDTTSAPSPTPMDTGKYNLSVFTFLVHHQWTLVNTNWHRLIQLFSIHISSTTPMDTG